MGNSILHTFEGKRAQVSNRFTSSMARDGDQPDPPSPSEEVHSQVPKTSNKNKDIVSNDVFVGNAPLSSNCKVKPIRDGGRDDALVCFNEHKPCSICRGFGSTPKKRNFEEQGLKNERRP